MYNEEATAHLNAEWAQVTPAYHELVGAFSGRIYRTVRAQEYAMHGFCRRLATLRDCIDIVFDAIPLTLEGLPDDEDRNLANIAVQAFLINEFGCADNLAALWVEERNIRKPNGNPLPDLLIGFSEKCERVRASLSQAFQDYLATRKDWLDEMEKFRHGLAHRIPPYIPPYSVDPANRDQERALDGEILSAIRAHDFERMEALKAQQQSLRFFVPVVTHSFWEQAPYLGFHSQLLIDFKTIEELAYRVTAELNGAGP